MMSRAVFAQFVFCSLTSKINISVKFLDILKSNEINKINIRLIGKIPQLTETQK